MKIPNWLLFAATCMIWGTTWFAIKMQLNEVSPLFSISYRFSLASIILFLFLAIKKKNLKYSFSQHRWFMLQGSLLFGLCYWFTYMAESGLTSGLVAVLSSLIIFFNVIFGRIFLKREVKPKLLVGFVIGAGGMALLYKDELNTAGLGKTGLYLLGIAIVSNLIASLGNIISARNQGAGLPIPQTNAFSMAYSSVFMFTIGLVKGEAISFEYTASYVLSLCYLAIFGSVIAFYCYLTILGKLGPGRAAYVNLVIPIVALMVSSFFESFQWNNTAILGLGLVLAGNWLALTKKTIFVRSSNPHKLLNHD